MADIESIAMSENEVLSFAHREFDTKTRKNLASKGHALPDGSYPMPDPDAVRRAAILAKSGHGNVAAAKRLIAKRSRELGIKNPLDDNDEDDKKSTAASEELVFDDWTTDYLDDTSEGTTYPDNAIENMAHTNYIHHFHTHSDGTTHKHPHYHMPNEPTHDNAAVHGDLTTRQMMAEPDQSDLHVNGSVNNKNERPRMNQNFLNRFYSNVRQRLSGSGTNYGPEEFRADVRAAAGYAGGVARAPAPDNASRAIAEDRGVIDHQGPATPGAANENTTYPLTVRVVAGDEYSPVFGNVADLCAYSFSDGGVKSDPGSELLIPVQFMEPPNRIPYLPKPGIHTHQKFGTVVITKDRNQRFMDNFKKGVYQTQLPIDAEHDTKTSGALGWIKDMAMNEDGSVDAIPEWTDRGRAMLKDNRFKFFSPEFFASWIDPSDVNQVPIPDVAIGGALVTRPFFKEKSLRSLVASEDGIELLARSLKPDKENNMPEETTTTETATEQQKYSEIQTELQKYKEEAQKYAERIEALESAARTQRFTEEVMGKSEDNNVRWFGEPEKKVTMLESLAQKFGEDSEEFKEYVTENRSYAQQLKTSTLFKEAGRTGFGGAQASPSQKFSELVNAKAAETGKSRVEAMEIVANEQPDLFEQHRRASTVVTKTATED